ncbi:hypothetical protein DFP74_3665 [Nocardiopsis sp. Huas11]|uniref:hypothetical protein n=1 Tax=Nocardiopsis sp. Huas11 TaxID=2183912 RepID=UPI000EAC0FD2|nr:hypothetical protein [Nocardiopsis sp. Huas11]RKS07977.1 hypothetical protein DFP74_3665 [Nocardiopsis sp. Huas11]
MSEGPYDVDTDMGDDPQESDIAGSERSIDADFNILGYDFEDDDSRGALGINAGVRAERSDVVPHQRWGAERSAEEQAVSIVSESESESESESAPEDRSEDV